MTKIFCDRCGKEMETVNSRVDIAIYRVLGATKTCERELCWGCISELEKWLKEGSAERDE